MHVEDVSTSFKDKNSEMNVYCLNWNVEQNVPEIIINKQCYGIHKSM